MQTRTDEGMLAGSVQGGVIDLAPTGLADRKRWKRDAAVDWLLSRFATARLWRSVAAALVVFSTVDALVFARVHRDASPQTALALAGLSIAPLLFVRWAPFATLGLAVAANGAFVVWSRLPWPPVSVIAWLVALAACPLMLSRPRSLVLLGISEIAVVVGASMPASLNGRPWDAPVTEALAAVLAWGAADTFRARREADLVRAGVAAEVRDMQEREALTRGRAAFARELHDVVAHQVSLIAVRAAMAPYQVEELSPAARDAFSEIAAQAREALEEMRTVLGVLRSTDGAVLHAPQPGLADLAALVARSRASGMSIDLQIDGSPVSTSESVQLCCYRLVQEGLTNAARHAPGAAVHVQLTYGSDLDVMITNAVDTRPGTTESAGLNGFGLIGMCERVTAVGGDLTASRQGTGFRVRARLPIAPAGHPHG
ncbi:MAG TPA: histidine kinase [Acidothermaceae bacterium]